MEDALCGTGYGALSVLTAAARNRTRTGTGEDAIRRLPLGRDALQSCGRFRTLMMDSALPVAPARSCAARRLSFAAAAEIVFAHHAFAHSRRWLDRAAQRIRKGCKEQSVRCEAACLGATAHIAQPMWLKHRREVHSALQRSQQATTTSCVATWARCDRRVPPTAGPGACSGSPKL